VSRSATTEAEAAVLALRTLYRVGQGVNATMMTDAITDLPLRIAKGLGFEFDEDDPRTDKVAKTALRGALAYLLGVATSDEVTAINATAMETDLRGYGLRGPIRRKESG